MSNHQYITQAIVCGSKASMTSDKSYLLFTQELGMLWATARSVRIEKSKQRYALQDFSIIRISLIHGRSVWRIGSVEALSNPFLASSNRASRGGISFIVKFLRRYVHGETSVPHAFSDMVIVLGLCNTTEDVEIIQLYQQLFSLRLLDELGYVKISQKVQTLVERENIEEAIKVYDVSMEKEVSACIDRASEVSHL